MVLTMSAVTRREYERRTLDDWYGTKVRLVREIQNGTTVLPAGSVWTITGKHQGFTLQGSQCPTCMVSVLITRVSPGAVEVVGDE